MSLLMAFKDIFKRNKQNSKDGNQKEQSKHVAQDGETVMRGFLGDADERTKVAGGITTIFITCVLIFVVMIFWNIKGFGDYRYIVRTNTTPPGTEMAFSQSEAPVMLDGVWTDKNRDVIVARIGYAEQSNQMLSTTGANYEIGLMAENPLAEKEKSDKETHLAMSYGILGTQGDGYLIMTGNFEEKAYQIIIRNYVNLATGETQYATNTAGDSVVADPDSNEMARMLAEYESDDLDTETGIVTNEDVENDRIETPDFINFRVNPYSPNTVVYDGSFLDEEGNLDYDEIIRATSISTIENDTRNKINTSRKNIEGYQAQVQEYTNRLQANPNDSGASGGLESAYANIEIEKSNIAQFIQQLDVLQNTSFKQSDFGDIQETMNFYPAG